jgi:hypothetical protein
MMNDLDMKDLDRLLKLVRAGKLPVREAKKRIMAMAQAGNPAAPANGAPGSVPWRPPDGPAATYAPAGVASSDDPTVRPDAGMTSAGTPSAAPPAGAISAATSAGTTSAAISAGMAASGGADRSAISGDRSAETASPLRHPEADVANAGGAAAATDSGGKPGAANRMPPEAAEKTENAVADLGFAQLDLEREQRTGFPEVVYGEGKSAEQLIAIVRKLMEHSDRVLATRIAPEKAAAVIEALPAVAYHETARALTWFRRPILRMHDGYVAVVCAGTSDMPVAEEAAITAECMGSRVERVYDVGVAGIHRLFRRLAVIRGADAIVVAAGMEGALASVVGGLVSCPVIAVPTSVGYGASFQGVAALLAMLNSCAAGVAVVNIDNGFGAGYYAALINKNTSKKRS